MPKPRYEKDADGLYYVYVPTHELRADGYTKYKKLKAKTQTALDEKKKKYDADFSAGVIPERITVDDWFARWFASYKSACAANTQLFYNYLYTNHIKPAIGATQLSTVRQVHAQRILSGMAATHAQKTVRDVRALLWALFDAARKNKLLAETPCENLKAAGQKTATRRALTEAERAAYLSAIPQDPFGTFAAFLYFFGLRRGEAAALTGADITPTYIIINKQITYPGNNQPVLTPYTKTDAGGREIPIPAKARAYIDFAHLPAGPLFLDSTGKPLSYTALTRRWQAFLARALGPDTDVTMHYVRHNYCTLLFEAGVDLLTAKRLAGHEDVETTLRIYTHYTDSLRAQGDDKVLSIG